ncbi:putative MATE family efflux protein [Fusibacter tunisiensis]|uniref:Probable multidrug resistance protein NorM n=2 Tax=Fusibacter tunisiensis TaxID=1008308 RepID=A0ABS2MPC9_9FIRM|nr:putative MATE family efflux protein [Fusibacter tunisiensis]
MIKSKKMDLTTGDIFKSLIVMALPIMGTSFVQMAYNLTDMFWIGFLGSDAVAAVGIAGFFVWFSQAFIILSKTGTEIRVAQTTGKKEDLQAEKYARNGLALVWIIAVLYGLGIVVFRNPLIGFFNTGDSHVESMATLYLALVGLGMIFPFSNQVFTGIFNGRGDSRTPFQFNVTGLLINIVLDPILILGLGPFPKMGVAGAAVATVIAQGIVFVLFVYNIKFKHALFDHFVFFKGIQISRFKEIMKLGSAPALQSGFFTLISMVIARIIAVYGPGPIATQKVGSQIESITWMTATGISVALSAFVGQNYGAGQYGRVVKGYRTAIKIAFALGIFNTFILFFGAKWLFMIFIREPDVIPLGIDYLRILGLSQLFMCIEITTTGAFNGIGHTKPAALIGIAFNILRIPMALYFSQMTFLGLNGIWWSISISSLFKGVIVYAIFEKLIRTRREFVTR